MRELFVAADGRVRAGWVVLVFALPAAFLMSLTTLVHAALGVRPSSLDDWRVLLATAGTCTAALVPTVLCALVFKEPVGLPRVAWARQLGAGFLAGGALLTLVAVVPPLLGHGTLGVTDAPVVTLALGGAQQLVTLGPAAVGEELLVRGVPLRALQRGTHPVFAVGATGAVFGLLHLGNPSATLLAAANVVLVGWFLGAVAVRTGALWMPIGLHAAWNWFEGFVFGLPVSGLRPGRALFTATSEERGFWSGGDFGPEASGWTAVLLVLALGATVAWPRRRGGDGDADAP